MARTGRPRKIITREELLTPVKRWGRLVRLRLLEAIQTGVIGLDEAAAAHDGLSADELAEWRRKCAVS